MIASSQGLNSAHLVSRKLICGSNPQELQKIRVYLKAAEARLARLKIIPRLVYYYPFDSVGLAIVSKVFALSRACLRLLHEGLSDEAFGLSRSVVKCATNLRYLTADPCLRDRRTRDFVKYFMADKAFWAHYALEQFAGKKEEDEIREYARQQGIVPDTKPARRHWSGLSGFIWDVMNIDHPLDGPVTPKHKKISYAADYFHSSAFVHCSLPAIDNYYADEGIPFCVSHSTGLHKTAQSTLYILAIYAHSSIAYALFGMGLDRPAQLNELFQRALTNLKPVPGTQD